VNRLWLLLTGLCFMLWIRNTFGGVSFDQLVFHVGFGYEGLKGTDANIIRTFFLWVVLAPGAVVGAFIFGVKKQSGFFSRLCSQVNQQVLQARFWLLALALPVWFLVSFDVFAYVRNSFSNEADFYATAYVDPKQVLIANTTPGTPKNLVLVYVESLEQGYANQKLFGKNLLAAIEHPARTNRGFSYVEYVQMPGTGWTTAALVASQCGLPLKTMTMLGDLNKEAKLQGLFPNATCLGDILAAQGYENIFINGPDLAFGGVGKFFQKHHYHSMLGREQWIERGILPSSTRKWGLGDDQLFEEGKKIILQKRASGQPFNLTILTVDTHGPDGTPSPFCTQSGYQEDFAGLVECTSALLADFIGFLEKHGLGEDTALVIQGDHLVMSNPLDEVLAKAEKRTIFNLIITGDNNLEPGRKQVNHFDMLPTILAAMGYQIPGGRLGLGYSAIGPDAPDVPEEWFTQLAENAMKRSASYAALRGR